MGTDLTAEAVNLAGLARQLAQEILPVGTILQMHKITALQWEVIQSDPNFQRMLADMATRWNSAENTKERIKIKAQTAVEALLEELFTEATNRSIPLNHRTEAVRQLSRWGELEGAKELGGGGGGGVQIQINIGGVTPPVTIEAQANQLEVEDVT